MTKAQYAVPFAAWDLRLFLDTHPNDTAALAAYRQLCSQAGKNYASVPDYMTNGVRFSWVDGPWPWEYCANPVNGGV